MAMTLYIQLIGIHVHTWVYYVCVDRKVAKNTWRKYLPIENCENSSYSAWDLSATRREENWTITIIWLRRHSLPEQWPRVEPVNSYARQTPSRWRERRAGFVLYVLLRYPQTGAGNYQAPARGRATISLPLAMAIISNSGPTTEFDLNLNTTLLLSKSQARGFQLSAVEFLLIIDLSHSTSIKVIRLHCYTVRCMYICRYHRYLLLLSGKVFYSIYELFTEYVPAVQKKFSSFNSP